MSILAENGFASPPSKCPANLLQAIQYEARVLSTMKSIIDKMENEGLLGLLMSALQTILDNEVQFAVRGFAAGEPTFESPQLRAHLKTNLYVFKENLKSISGFMSELSSRESFRGAD